MTHINNPDLRRIRQLRKIVKKQTDQFIDANRLLAAIDFNSPENQNRDKAIIGYGPVIIKLQNDKK